MDHGDEGGGGGGGQLEQAGALLDGGGVQGHCEEEHLSVQHEHGLGVYHPEDGAVGGKDMTVSNNTPRRTARPRRRGGSGCKPGIVQSRLDSFIVKFPNLAVSKPRQTGINGSIEKRQFE